MNKKLKWASVICAAANGEIIERRCAHIDSIVEAFKEWHVPSMPLKHLLYELSCAYEGWEYRVKKPDRVVYRHLYAGQYLDYDSQRQQTYEFGEQFKLTYCSDTGKLKTVEIVEND